MIILYCWISALSSFTPSTSLTRWFTFFIPVWGQRGVLVAATLWRIRDSCCLSRQRFLVQRRSRSVRSPTVFTFLHVVVCRRTVGHAPSANRHQDFHFSFSLSTLFSLTSRFGHASKDKHKIAYEINESNMNMECNPGIAKSQIFYNPKIMGLRHTLIRFSNRTPADRSKTHDPKDCLRKF